jgi:hypothetical protein
MQVVFKILAIMASAMFARVLIAISATRKLTLKSISVGADNAQSRRAVPGISGRRSPVNG